MNQGTRGSCARRRRISTPASRAGASVPSRMSSARRRASRKSPRAKAWCTGEVTCTGKEGASGGLGGGVGPQLLVMVVEHLGALVILAPNMNGIVWAIELAHRAAGTFLEIDDRHRRGNAAYAPNGRRSRLHGDAVERAGVHAVDAASALFELHEG